jgi:hypothetical protein
VLNQETYDNDIYGRPSGRDLLENIKLLIVALDIECEIIDRTGIKHVHSPDWTKMAPEDFLNIIVLDPSPHGRHYQYGTVGKPTTIAAHIHLIDNLVDQHNNIYGRGAISMFETRSQRYVSIGGLVSEFMSLASFEIPYIGVIRGETDEISRRSAALDVPASVLAAWASRQANLIDRAHFRTPELMQAAYNIVRAGGDPGSLPFCLSGRNFVSFENFRRSISEFSSVDLPVRHDYGNTFSLHGLDTLDPDYLLSENDANVVVVLTEREFLFANEMMGRRILDDGEADLSEDDLRVEGPFELLRDICREIWGCMPKMKVTTRTIVLNDYF